MATTSSSPNVLVPLLAVAGLGAVLFYTHKSSAATPAKPAPGPVPGPAPDANALVLQAQQLLQQAAANPGTFDATKIGALASQLRAAGQPAAAAQLEATGAQICAAQGKAAGCWNLPPAPNPNPMPGPAPTPDVSALLVQAGALVQQATMNPNSVNATQIGILAAQLRAGGRPTEATQLEAFGAQLCAAQGKDPTCWNAPPAPGGVAVPNPNPAASAARLAQAKAAADAFYANPTPAGAQAAAAVAATFRDLGDMASANQLDSAAKRYLATGIVNAMPGTLPPMVASQVTAVLDPARPMTTSADVLRVMALIQDNFPGGFATQIAQLKDRMRLLQDAGR